MNTAVKHIFPEQPAPSAEDDEDKAQLNKPDGDQREAREEEPLLRGTPLDELTTPGIGLPASEPKVEAIKEETRQDHRRDSRMGATKRPNLNATRGIGSDSVSVFPSHQSEMLFMREEGSAGRRLERAKSACVGHLWIHSMTRSNSVFHSPGNL
jgi:hypothetical protein